MGLAVLLLSTAFASSSARAGGAAPDFNLTDVDGNNVNLTMFRGKIVLLDFMAVYCASCELARPVLLDVYNAHSDVMAGVSIDVWSQIENETLLRAWRDGSHTNPPSPSIPWRVALDTDNVQTKYGVSDIVRIFLVDQNGFLIFDKMGLTPFETDSFRASLEASIAAAIRGEATPIQLQQVGIYALAALAAVGSFFSPCSFPLFPGYMAFFLGLDSSNPDQRRRRRSVRYGVISSFGIILVYGIIGAAILAIGAAAAAVVPALQPIVGVLLVLLGAVMFTAVQFNWLVNPFRRVRQRLFPDWTPNTVQSTSGKLFSYGVGYGAAGFGCVAPPFIAAVLNATTLGGTMGGLAVLLTYASIVVGLTIATTFVLATLGQTALRKINRYTEAIKRISAVVLIIAGAYLLYYWYAAWIAS